MPAIIKWDYNSEAFRKLEPYLHGDFTCERCGTPYKLWHPMCKWCEGGSITPIPNVPEERVFLFPADRILRVLQGRRWEPRELQEIGIEPIIERSRYPTPVVDFLFRRTADLQPAGPFSMTLGEHPDEIRLEAAVDHWGPVPMVRFEVNEFKNAMRRGDTVQVKVTAMVPLELFPAA